MYSVDTKAEASKLIVMVGSMSYDRRYVMPFSGDFKDLEDAGECLRAAHEFAQPNQ